MKKIAAIVLALIMAFSLVSCSNSKDAGGTGVISPEPKDGKPVLTIMLNTIEYDTLTRTKCFSEYIDKFKSDFGVDIKLEKLMSNPNGLITSEEQSEYIQKLSTKLFTKDGPELIFAQYMSMEALIKQQAVVDVKGKVPNLDRIYDSLVGDKLYYVPLGLLYYSRNVNKEALERLKIEKPGFDWASKDYYAIRDKWLSQNKIWFNGDEYSKVFNQFIDFDSLYKAGEKKITINTPEVRQRINDARNHIFGGNYKLTNGYKYENYYNMAFEDKSEEYKLGFQYYEENNSDDYIDAGIMANIFRAGELDRNNKSYGTVMYPQFKDKEIMMDSYGFLVNKNGKNLDLAYEFINGLLGDEVQMSMFDSDRAYYPVNKKIEADILKREANTSLDPEVIKLKAYALKQLRDGGYKLWVTTDNDIYKMQMLLYKDMGKFILADNPYSDEQLQAELKKLEDKYNIILNE